MSKVLVIPDMHGSHNWEKAKEIIKEHPDWYAVCLGDWVDSGIYDRKIKAWRSNNKWPDQGENLKASLEWCREDPEHRKWCIGNHDWSYLSATREGMYVSGHQSEHGREISAILNAYKDVILIAAEIDGWVFSHAGFTKTWINSMKHQLHIMKDKWPEEDDGKSIIWDESVYNINFLNSVLKSVTHIPGDPDTSLGFDELLDWHGYMSSSGNEICQGPLWIRPEALLRDAAYPKQVVGHTELCMGEPVFLEGKEGKVIIVDSREHDLLYVLDTEKDDGYYMTYMNYNRVSKHIDKALNTILSQKLTDEDAIKNELMNGGVKKEQLDSYLKLLKEFYG